MPRIITWNIRHGGSDRAAIADAVAAMEPDVAVITEFRDSAPGGDLVSELARRALGHAIHSHAAPKANGVLIASKHCLAPGLLCQLAGLGHRWVHAYVLAIAIEVAGAYIPNWKYDSNDKQAFWDWMLGAARSLSDRPAIVAGDWNTGSQLIDERERPSDAPHRSKR